MERILSNNVLQVMYLLLITLEIRKVLCKTHFRKVDELMTVDHAMSNEMIGVSGESVVFTCPTQAVRQCGSVYSIEWYKIVHLPHHSSRSKVVVRDGVKNVTSDTLTRVVQQKRVFVFRKVMKQGEIPQIRSQGDWKGRVKLYTQQQRNDLYFDYNDPDSGGAENLYENQYYMGGENEDLSVFLDNVELSDQSDYRCELTYENLDSVTGDILSSSSVVDDNGGERRWMDASCLTSYFTKLRVISYPKRISISYSVNNSTMMEVDDGKSSTTDYHVESRKAKVLGPFTEGDVLDMICESHGGYPKPQIIWKNDTEMVLSTPIPSVIQTTGSRPPPNMTIVQSHVRLTLTQEHDGQSVQCEAVSKDIASVLSKRSSPPFSKLERPLLDLNKQRLTSSIKISMNKKLNNLRLEVKTGGVIVEGSRVTLECNAFGAKPPAYIYWNSEPDLEFDDIKEEVIPNFEVNKRDEDGQRVIKSYTTISMLEFKARKHLESLSCFASNKVMDETNSKHMKRATTFDVNFRPNVVTIKDISETKAVKGEVVYINCDYTANPRGNAIVIWYKDGNSIFHTTDMFSEQPYYTTQHRDMSSLAINAMDNSIEGMYSCQVENSIGESDIVNITEIIFQENPNDVYLEFNPPSPINEIDNANVSLKCHFKEKGSPFYAVKWMLDGEVLKQVNVTPKCIHETDLQTLSPVRPTECMDPSMIVLVNVRRPFRGNYSCQGLNPDGWTETSKPKPLIVQYPPIGAKITKNPDIIKKGRPFSLTCAPLIDGSPLIHSVQWYHEGHLLHNQMSRSMMVDEASSQNIGKYTCIPYNAAGKARKPMSHQMSTIINDELRSNVTTDSIKDDLSRIHNDEKYVAYSSVHIDVHVKPQFTVQLPPYSGTPYNSRSARLRCVVECDPICSIDWFQNDKAIPHDTSPITKLDELMSQGHFRITSHAISADEEKNTLLQIESILDIHFTQSIDLQQLLEEEKKFNDQGEENYYEDEYDYGDKSEDSSHEKLIPLRNNVNYTCKASANELGKSISSSTFMKSHYPPTRITATPKHSIVKEGNFVEPFRCATEAYPPAKYYWQKNHGNWTQSGAELNFRRPVHRKQGGIYTCTAYNGLGHLKTDVKLEVVYKPTCHIKKEMNVEGQLLLKCVTEDNLPDDTLSFHWSLSSMPNDEESESMDIFESIPDRAILDATNLLLMNTLSNATLSKYEQHLAPSIERKIRCRVRNKIGLGDPCWTFVDNKNHAASSVQATAANGAAASFINQSGGKLKISIFTAVIIACFLVFILFVISFGRQAFTSYTNASRRQHANDRYPSDKSDNRGVVSDYRGDENRQHLTTTFLDKQNVQDGYGNEISDNTNLAYQYNQQSMREGEMAEDSSGDRGDRSDFNHLSSDSDNWITTSATPQLHEDHDNLVKRIIHGNSSPRKPTRPHIWMQNENPLKQNDSGRTGGSNENSWIKFPYNKKVRSKSGQRSATGDHHVNNVTIVNGTTTIEGYEKAYNPAGAVCVVNSVTRTCQLDGLQAPKELWLV